MIMILKCSCDWTLPSETKDPKGIFLKELKEIHERIFIDHKVVIEG